MPIFVQGGSICGRRKEETRFVSTGDNKGHYPVHICDREPHDTGQHRDSKTSKRWF